MEEKTNNEFMSKAQMLKNAKKNYTAHRMSYKQYMIEIHYIENHYDEMKAEYEKAQAEQNVENTQPNEPQMNIPENISINDVV